MTSRGNGGFALALALVVGACGTVGDQATEGTVASHNEPTGLPVTAVAPICADYPEVVENQNVAVLREGLAQGAPPAVAVAVETLETFAGPERVRTIADDVAVEEAWDTVGGHLKELCGETPG